MDRRIAMVGTIAVAFLGSCTSIAPPSGNASSASASAPGAVTSPAATANPFGSWVPAAVVTLGATSSLPIGDFFPQRLEATAERYLLIGTDGNTDTFLVGGSADAMSWSRLDVAGFGGAIGDIAAGPRGAILSTHDAAGGRVHLWFSPDGVTWGLVPDPPGFDSLAGEQLTAGPGGFSLTGDVGSPDSSTTAAWTSPNGHDWVTARVGSAGLARIEPLDGAFVAFGYDGTAEHVSVSLDGGSFADDPGAATSPLAGQVVLAMPVGRKLLVVDRPGSGSVSWLGEVTSAGTSVTWSRQSDVPFQGREVVAGTMVGNEAALLGYQDVAFHAVSWTTRNGSAFEPTEQGSAQLGGGVSHLLASTGSSVATLGWEAGDPGRVIRAIWRSDEGTDWSEAYTDVFGTLVPLPSPGTCPSSPMTARALLVLPRVSFPSCYGDRTIEITGYATDCGGCGGTTPYTGAPAWLYDPIGFSAFWLAGQAGTPAGTDAPTLPVDIDPAHPVRVPPIGSHVRLVGHFVDPASATCREVPDPSTGAELPPAAIAIETCREEFVVTAATILK